MARVLVRMSSGVSLVLHISLATFTADVTAAALGGDVVKEYTEEGGPIMVDLTNIDYFKAY